MHKAILIWACSLLSILCWADESMRVVCVNQIRCAKESNTIVEKQKTLDAMRKHYPVFGNMSAYRTAGVAPILCLRWLNEYAKLNRFFGNYSEAEHAYDAIIEMSGNKLESYRMNAYQSRLSIWLRQGKYNEIIDFPDSLLPQSDSLRSDVRLIRAEAYYNRNLYDDVQKAYLLFEEEKTKHAVSRDVYYIKALNGLGLMLSGMEGAKLSTAYTTLLEGMSLLSEKKVDALSFVEQNYYYTILSNLAYTEARLHLFDDAIMHIDEVMKWQRMNYPEGDNHYITSLWKKALILYEQTQMDSSASASMIRAFKDYFYHERSYILHNFAFMTEHERLSFWSAQYELLSSCYLVGSADPDFVYQVALFVKNIHIQTRMDIRELAASKHNSILDSLINQYEYSHCMGDKEEKLLMQVLGADRLYQQFRSSMTMTPNHIRKHLMDGEVAIEWVETLVNGDSTYVALVLDRNNPVRFIPVITKRNLFDRDVSGVNFQPSLTSTNGSVKEYIYTDSVLGEIFWKNIINEIPIGSNVYFAPIGVMNILAVEYLNFQKNACRLFRLSSTGELCRKNRRSKQPENILLIGGVDYNKSDQTVSTAAIPDRSGFQMLSSIKTFGLDSPFKYLAGATNEVDSIYEILDGSFQTTLVKGSHASESFIKDQMPEFAIIHISTHGYSMDYMSRKVLQPDSLMQDELLLRSGLALSGANTVAKNCNDQEDGLLTAREISEMDLRGVRLVVLSACQTAVAKMTEEEVASISRAFKKAGVETLIVSLWSTGDLASQMFFTNFFTYLKTNPNSVHAAFDKARDYMMTIGEVEITNKIRTLSPGKLSGKSDRMVTRKINLSQVAYYDSYILIDAK